MFTSALPLNAQTHVSGKVLDDEGNAVVGANVILKDTYDGATSMENGEYSFETIESGEHILQISFFGFKDLEQAISISGDSVSMDLNLEIDYTQLERVTISAGSFEASDEKKAVILRPLDIVTTAGAAGDIYGALQTLPGTSTVGEEEGLFVRGGDAREAKTIIDGLLVQNPYFGNTPDVPSRGRFNPFLFKGTIFATGAYSAEYGQALSSALILESQDKSDQTSSGLSLMPIGGGAFHNQAGKNASWSIGADYTNLHPYFQIFPQKQNWRKAPEGINIQSSYKRRFKEASQYKLFGSFGKQNLAMDNPDIDLLTSRDSFALKNQNIYINSSVKHFFGDGWMLYAGGTFTDDKNEIERGRIGWHNETETTDQFAQGKITLSRGIFSRARLKFGGEGYTQVSRFESTTGSFDIQDTVFENYYAGFVESDLPFRKNWALRLGLRSEYSDLLEKANIAPRAALAYQTGEKSQISLGFGHFYQTPGTQFIAVDEDLEFERADHYIANYQWLGEKRTFRIEAYHKEYSSLILNDTIPFAYTNDGEGYARGLDLFWRDKDLMPFTDYWISYSYLDTRRWYLHFPEEAQPTFASTHNLSVVYKRYLAKIQSQLGLTYNFASGRPYYNPNNPNFLEDRAPDFHKISLSGSYITSILDNFTVIFISVDNLLNTKNIYGYRYSTDGSYREEITASRGITLFAGLFIAIGIDQP